MTCGRNFLRGFMPEVTSEAQAHVGFGGLAVAGDLKLEEKDLDLEVFFML